MFHLDGYGPDGPKPLQSPRTFVDVR
jgi:hypothetical protein